MMKRLLACSALLALMVMTPISAPAQIQAERLGRLADHLEARVSPEHFDIMNWGNVDRPSEPYYVGCAAGHATALFTEDGFRYQRPCGYPVVTYRGSSGLWACQEFFGIDAETARLLFTNQGGANRDPKAAARNVRSVLMFHAGAPDYQSAWGRTLDLMAKRE